MVRRARAVSVTTLALHPHGKARDLVGLYEERLGGGPTRRAASSNRWPRGWLPAGKPLAAAGAWRLASWRPSSYERALERRWLPWSR